MHNLSIFSWLKYLNESHARISFYFVVLQIKTKIYNMRNVQLSSAREKFSNITWSSDSASKLQRQMLIHLFYLFAEKSVTEYYDVSHRHCLQANHFILFFTVRMH